MDIHLDPDTGIPIYMQIMDRIKYLVAIGRLQPGERLPTMRQLAADLRINYNTVAKAYALLSAERIISTQQGRGCFVTERPDEADFAEVRRERLRAMLGERLLQVLGLGYTEEEIRETFEERLIHLLRDNGPQSS